MNDDDAFNIAFDKRVPFNSLTSAAAIELLDAIDLFAKIGTTHCNPYLVPRGFFDEKLTTKLHKSLRFLRDFRKIREVNCGLPGFEGWRS